MTRYQMYEDKEIPVFKKGYYYEPHPAQALMHASDARFRHGVMGRKFGKTMWLIQEFMRYAGVPESVCWWLSPQYSVSKIGWTRLLAALNPEMIKHRNTRDYEITLINDTRLCYKTGEHEKGLVGEGVDFCAVDEAALINESLWLRAVRPNLGDQDVTGHACFVTTPHGLDWIYRDWRKGLDPAFPEYESWAFKLLQTPITGELVGNYEGGFPSWVNPHWPKRELMDVVHGPKGVFMEQYAARFLETLSNVFSGVLGLYETDFKRFELPSKDKKYYVGFDVARSGVGDNAVIAVVDENHRLVYMSAMVGRGYQYQMDEARTIAEDYNAAPIYVDSTGKMGDPVSELLQGRYENTVPYHFTNRSKRDLVDNLSVLVHTGKLKLPEDEYESQELVKEMRVFGAERTKTGEVVYEAAKSFKDDRIIATSLACWGLKEESSAWQPGWGFVTF